MISSEPVSSSSKRSLASICTHFFCQYSHFVLNSNSDKWLSDLFYPEIENMRSFDLQYHISSSVLLWHVIYTEKLGIVRSCSSMARKTAECLAG